MPSQNMNVTVITHHDGTSKEEPWGNRRCDYSHSFARVTMIIFTVCPSSSTGKL